MIEFVSERVYVLLLYMSQCLFCTETFVCFVIDSKPICNQMLTQSKYVVLTSVYSGVINLESRLCNGTVSFKRHVQRIVCTNNNARQGAPGECAQQWRCIVRSVVHFDSIAARLDINCQEEQFDYL